MKTKEQYIEKLSAELKVWSAQIDDLTVKADNAVEDMKLKYHSEIDVLRAKQRIAAEKILELESSSGDAWESIKETAEHIWDDLRKGVDNVVSKFK